MLSRSTSRVTALLASVVALLLGGCTEAVRWVGVRLLYERVPAPPERVLYDLTYRVGSADPKHRLDLFLPADPEGWPTLVFVHGGG